MMGSINMPLPQMNEIIHVQNMNSPPEKKHINLQSIEERNTENANSSRITRNPGLTVKVSKFGEDTGVNEPLSPSKSKWSFNQTNTLYTAGNLSPTKTQASKMAFTKSQWTRLGSVTYVAGKTKRKTGKRRIDRTIKKYFGE